MAQTPGQRSKDNLFVRVLRWMLGTWQGRVVGVALVIALLVSLAIWLYWWPESGFDEFQGKDNFERRKTLWDWLDLLLVPAVLAGGGLLFSRAERRTEQKIAADRARQERQAADKRADLDRELADKRANAERERADDALRQALVQDYLDRMSELLFSKENELTSSAPEDLVRKVARARTLTVLRGLGEDGARKGYIVQFLNETGLIKGKEPVVELKGATLQKANLSGVTLNEANLSGAEFTKADLSRAQFSGAHLSDAHLFNANLSLANLSLANLSRADLSGANLRDANLRGAHLSEAHLSEADLSGAHLRDADLFDANLSLANLSGAHLIGTTLSRADLRDANRHRCTIE